MVRAPQAGSPTPYRMGRRAPAAPPHPPVSRLPPRRPAERGDASLAFPPGVGLTSHPRTASAWHQAFPARMTQFVPDGNAGQEDGPSHKRREGKQDAEGGSDRSQQVEYPEEEQGIPFTHVQGYGENHPSQTRESYKSAFFRCLIAPSH